MNTQMDPADAARALQTAADQRRTLAQETRRPLWTYVGLFLYCIVLFTLEDFVPEVSYWLILGLAVVLLLRRWAPGITLRARTLLKLRPRAAYGAVPAHTRIAITVVMLAMVVGVYALASVNLPADVGAPSWAVHHALTVYGVIIAIVMMPVTWLIDRITRYYVARGTR